MMVDCWGGKVDEEAVHNPHRHEQASRMKMEARRGVSSMVPPTPSTAPSLSTLPDALLHEVVEFLVPLEPTDLLMDNDYFPRISPHSQPLRLVSRSWKSVLESRMLEGMLRCITLDFSSRAGRRLPSRAGLKIRSLSITMEPFYDYGFIGNAYAVKAEDTDPATWDEVFKYMPNLRRLDLSSVPLAVVAPMLASASRHCPCLRWLEFISGQSRLLDGLQDPVVIEAITTALRDALQQWHRANGGLRALSIPRWVTTRSDDFAQFFVDVTAYCPRISRILEVSQDELFSSSTSNPTYPWPPLPLDVWARFCETCSDLRAMSWGFVPVSKPYVDTFLAHNRSSLQQLKVHSPDEGLVMRMIEASPMLTRVDISLWDDMRPAATSAMDKVVHHLVHHCKHLETCELRDVSPGAMEALIRVDTIRDFKMVCSEVTFESLIQIVRSTCVADDRKITINTPHSSLSAIYQLLRVLERDTQELFSHKQLVLSIHHQRRSWLRGNDQIPVKLENIVHAVNSKLAGSRSYAHLTVMSQWIGGEKVDYVKNFQLVLNLCRKKPSLAEPGMFWVGNATPPPATATVTPHRVLF